METQAPIIAFLYDFDKTLCTTDMEDYAFIPSLGYTPAEFWGRANAFGWENRMDGLLAYMYTMIQECAAQNIKLDRAFLNHCGESIQLFPGVREWFARINAFGESLGVQVEHYVISSGLREIIEGSGIAQEFREIYACEFYYNENGDACWPKLDVNFTNKTQFVYRINKGILDVSRDKELNDSMPDDSKRVPFTNMIYMGDGLSDVPCMKMMRAYGGQAIAVWWPSSSMRNPPARWNRPSDRRCWHARKCPRAAPAPSSSLNGRSCWTIWSAAARCWTRQCPPSC